MTLYFYYCAVVIANDLPTDTKEFCHKSSCYHIAFIVRHLLPSSEPLEKIVYSLRHRLINRYKKSW